MPALSLVLVCKQWKERIAHFKACYFEMFTIRNLKEFVSVVRAQFPSLLFFSLAFSDAISI